MREVTKFACINFQTLWYQYTGSIGHPSWSYNSNDVDRFLRHNIRLILADFNRVSIRSPNYFVNAGCTRTKKQMSNRVEGHSLCPASRHNHVFVTVDMHIENITFYFMNK